MESMSDGPPDDGYGRVTNPERFRPVHAAADDLVARLQSQYQVERRDAGEAAHEGVVRQVELVPPVGAPLAIRWDRFPGLAVHYGRWHDESYPRCGCDACHEQPDELIEDLQRKIAAVVAGRFAEAVVSEPDGVWVAYEFRFDGHGRSSGRGRLPEGIPPGEAFGEVVWPPWPLLESNDD
jgi:hypothetical protein